MKKKFILNLNIKKNTVKLFAKGKTTTCKIAEGLDTEDIPLNGVGLVDNIDGTEILVGYKKEKPFASLLEVGGE